MLTTFACSYGKHSDCANKHCECACHSKTNEADSLKKCTGATSVTVTHERRNSDGSLEVISTEASTELGDDSQPTHQIDPYD